MNEYDICPQCNKGILFKSFVSEKKQLQCEKCCNTFILKKKDRRIHKR